LAQREGGRNTHDKRVEEVAVLALDRRLAQNRDLEARLVGLGDVDGALSGVLVVALDTSTDVRGRVDLV
jgi:hypothetical protein